MSPCLNLPYLVTPLRTIVSIYTSHAPILHCDRAAHYISDGKCLTWHERLVSAGQTAVSYQSHRQVCITPPTANLLVKTRANTTLCRDTDVFQQ